MSQHTKEKGELEMKIKKAVVVAFLLLILGAVGFRATFKATPVSAGNTIVVVHLLCHFNSTVITYDGSAGAPAQPVGTCAQIVATLLNDGFTLHEVSSLAASMNQEELDSYLLIRSTD